MAQKNPSSRRYTYYSQPHRSFSCIDHTFLSTSMIPEIISQSTTPFPCTHHCAVYTTIASPIPMSHNTSWTINDTTLTHPAHYLEIEVALTNYLSNNDTDNISELTLWETHKAVIRGKRDHKIQFEQLEANYTASHSAFQATPNASTNVHLDRACLDLDMFLTDSSDKLIRKRQHFSYLKANKLDTPMARILQTKQPPTDIYSPKKIPVTPTPATS